MIFGNPEDFAIEAESDATDTSPAGTVWGHMRIWCRGVSFGDFKEIGERPSMNSKDSSSAAMTACTLSSWGPGHISCDACKSASIASGARLLVLTRGAWRWKLREVAGKLRSHRQRPGPG